MYLVTAPWVQGLSVQLTRKASQTVNNIRKTIFIGCLQGSAVGKDIGKDTCKVQGSRRRKLAVHTTSAHHSWMPG